MPFRPPFLFCYSSGPIFYFNLFYFGSRFLIRRGHHFYFICFDVSFRFLFQRIINFFSSPLRQNAMKSLVFKPGYTHPIAHQSALDAYPVEFIPVSVFNYPARRV